MMSLKALMERNEVYSTILSEKKKAIFIIVYSVNNLKNTKSSSFLHYFLIPYHTHTQDKKKRCHNVQGSYLIDKDLR